MSPDGIPVPLRASGSTLAGSKSVSMVVPTVSISEGSDRRASGWASLVRSAPITSCWRLARL